MEGKENSKVFTLQILGKEKDSWISLGERILDNLTQIESICSVWRSEMKCQRCLRDGAQAIYRVSTEMINIEICAWCADEARKLGISVEPLDSGEVIRFQPVRASDI